MSQPVKQHSLNIKSSILFKLSIPVGSAVISTIHYERSKSKSHEMYLYDGTTISVPQ